MTLTHVPSAILPLNEATVDALCDAVARRDELCAFYADPPMVHESDHAPERLAYYLARRVAIQETLNELAPGGES